MTTPNPEPTAQPSAADIQCPFCREDDFDLIGLKLHLGLWCKPFDSISVEDRAK